MTDIQKGIYNQYLKAIAKVNNRPYKLRKDFEKLEEELKAVLYRLELFFNKFNHIDPYNFFLAYLEYREIKFANLSDYLTQKAIIAYSKHNKNKYDEYVDSNKSLEDFVQGFKNIVAFCLSNNLPTKEYRMAVNNINVPWILIHLNEQKISYYHLHALDISRTELNSDYIEILFHDFDKVFQETKQKYISSNKLKELGNKLKSKIERN